MPRTTAFALDLALALKCSISAFKRFLQIGGVRVLRFGSGQRLYSNTGNEVGSRRYRTLAA